MNLDKHQLLLWQKLIELAKQINKNKQLSFLDKIMFWQTKKIQNNKSFYIYGGPGCGKTTIMKKFYQQLSLPKQYHHFHAFMQKVHSNLHQIRTKKHHQQHAHWQLEYQTQHQQQLPGITDTHNNIHQNI